MGGAPTSEGHRVSAIPTGDSDTCVWNEDELLESAGVAPAPRAYCIEFDTFGDDAREVGLESCTDFVNTNTNDPFRGLSCAGASELYSCNEPLPGR
jgi:hypothetical protein